MCVGVCLCTVCLFVRVSVYDSPPVAIAVLAHSHRQTHTQEELMTHNLATISHSKYCKAHWFLTAEADVRPGRVNALTLSTPLADRYF